MFVAECTVAMRSAGNYGEKKTWKQDVYPAHIGGAQQKMCHDHFCVGSSIAAELHTMFEC